MCLSVYHLKGLIFLTRKCAELKDDQNLKKRWSLWKIKKYVNCMQFRNLNMQSRSSRNKSRCMKFRLRNLSLCNVCCLKMYIFIFFHFFSVYRINGGFRFRGGCHSNRCLHSEGSGRTVTSYDAMKTSNTDTSCLYMSGSVVFVCFDKNFSPTNVWDISVNRFQHWSPPRGPSSTTTQSSHSRPG